jgi:DNA modification methylase
VWRTRTQRDDFNRLTRGEELDCILTDPPYCSGGFQESDRVQGSIGTTRKDYTGQTVSIANDVLSTRGYKALIGRPRRLERQARVLFTDWRMWTHLTDVMESQGYGIRSLIVWDKGRLAWAAAGCRSMS